MRSLAPFSGDDYISVLTKGSFFLIGPPPTLRSDQVLAPRVSFKEALFFGNPRETSGSILSCVWRWWGFVAGRGIFVRIHRVGTFL